MEVIGDGFILGSVELGHQRAVVDILSPGLNYVGREFLILLYFLNVDGHNAACMASTIGVRHKAVIFVLQW